MSNTKQTQQIRAIVITPRTADVREVRLELDGNYSKFNAQLCEIIGCTLLDAVRLAAGDAIFIDDEGLFNSPESTDTFMYGEYPSPLAGVGVIVGSDSDGESTDAKVTLADVISKARFTRESLLRRMFPDGKDDKLKILAALGSKQHTQENTDE